MAVVIVCIAFAVFIAIAKSIPADKGWSGRTWATRDDEENNPN
jgi:hypothetical protein